MKISTQDKVAGAAKNLSGTVKEVAGKMTGSQRLRDEGKAEKTEGKIQKKVGEIEKVLGAKPKGTLFMNTWLKYSKPLSLLVAISALALGSMTGGCAATRTSDSTGQYVDDSVITTRVKKALLEDKEVKSFDVGVETMKGVVQLSGFVNTSDQRSAAGRDASEVPGVKDVENNLIVK